MYLFKTTMSNKKFKFKIKYIFKILKYKIKYLVFKQIKSDEKNLSNINLIKIKNNKFN